MKTDLDKMMDEILGPIEEEAGTEAKLEIQEELIKKKDAED